MSRSLFFLLLISLSPASALEPQSSPKAKPWQKLENVTYKDHPYNDGDSFHVITEEGNELVLRLYFVDTPEEEKVYMDRIEDQAAYFGVSENTVIKLGHEASAFTRRLLEKPFTVQTRWHRALGRSKQERWYCVIITADGKDLAQELVRNAYARIYGTRTILWDGRTSAEYNFRLMEIGLEAKAAGLGGWRGAGLN